MKKRIKRKNPDITEQHLRRLLKERDYEREKLDKLVEAILINDETQISKIIKQHLEDVPYIEFRHRKK